MLACYVIPSRVSYFVTANMKFLFILLFLSLATSTKFNAVMVRLPLFDDFTVSYNLEVKDGGCYNWHSSRDDVAVVFPVHTTENDACSNKAIVSATPHRMSRGVTDISATDVNTGEVFLIEVEVARIAHLEFSFPSPGRRAELFLGGSRRHYRVSAKDEFGTSFTSLDGVPFEWEVRGYGTQPAKVKIVRASDTYYAVSDAINELETRGLTGNTVLLEGTEAGSAQLVVRLPHPEYDHVNIIERKIAVLQELLLRPSVVVLAPDDILVYSIVQLHSGKFQPVTLDRSLYEIHIENSSVIELRSDLGPNTVVSKIIGRTRVLLREIPAESYDVSDPLDSHITATSDVTVSAPVSLSVRVIPHNVLVIGSEFTLKIGLRDSHKRELHIGPHTLVATSLNPLSSVNVWTKSDNGTVITGLASNISVVYIDAKLITLAGEQCKTEIKGYGTLTIISALKLIPEKMVIPYIAGMKPSTQRLLIEGGVPHDDSGEPARPAEDYVNLLSSDTSVVSVMNDGLLVPDKLGSTRITARLKDHKHIEAHARVMVVEVLNLRIARVVTLPSGFKDGATHALHIALWANHPETGVPLPVTNCDSTHMQLITLEGLEFYQITNPSDIIPVGQACTVMLAKASHLGTALVQVSLRGLSDTVRLWVHAPLKLKWPATDKIALGLGSSLNIILTGGPLPSSAPYDIIGHSSAKKIVTIKKQSVQPYSLPHARVYNIVCHKNGEAVIDFSTFLVKNNVYSYTGDRAHKSYHEIDEEDLEAKKEMYLDGETNQGGFDLDLIVHCVDRIDTIHIDTLKLPKECPEIKQKVYVYPGDQENKINLSFSANGIILYNVSGIDLEWTISHPIVSLADNDAVKVHYLKKYQPISVPDHFYQFLKANPDVNSGATTSEVKLFASRAVNGFNATVVQHLQLNRNVVRILPELNRDVLVATLHGGSGHHHISRVLASVPWKYETSDVVSVRLSKSGVLLLKALTSAPATVRIDVQDLCLQHYSISLDVHLESVGAVHAVGPSAFAVDSTVQVAVYALSGRDRTVLPTSLTPPMSIVSSSSAPRELLIRKLKVTENETIYELYGIHPGVHTLRWMCGGRASQGVRVRVFPRLYLWPRSATVPPHATMRIATLTKPPSNIATISYSSKPEGIIEVLPSGVVNVLASATSAATVTGVAISHNGEILSQDTVTIRILPIQGINIQAPTVEIEVGKTIPLWLTSLPNEMDRTQLCALQQSLSFVWNVADYVSEDMDITLIHPVTGADLIGVAKSEGCVGRFTALQLGKYTVTANVVYPGSITWMASTEIWVKPSKWAEPIVLQKGLEMKISTLSRTHSYQKVQYSILSSSNALKVNDAGVVSDAGSKGTAGVVTVQGSTDDIFYPIEWSSVNYIMLSVKDRNVQLAVGDRLKLRLSMHDVNGRTILNAKRNPVKVTSSRPDIAKTHLSDDRSILTVDVVSDGAAVLLVETRDSESNVLLQDHIRIHSAPQLWLPVGAVLCGNWECEHPQENRALRHLGIGLVQIVEHLSSGIWLKESKAKKRIYINTTPVTKVSILKTAAVVSDGNNLNVEMYNNDPVLVHVLLSGKMQNPGTQVINTMCNGNNLTLLEDFLVKKMIHPYTCNLEYRHEYSKYRPVVEAVPIFDFDTGKFACRVRLMSEAPSTKKILGKLIVRPHSNKAPFEEAHATLLFIRRQQGDDQCSPSFLVLTISNLLYIVFVAILMSAMVIFAVKGFTKTSQSVADRPLMTSTPEQNLSKTFNSSKTGMRSLINSSISSDPDSSRPIYGGPANQPRNRFPHTFLSPN